MECNIDRHEQRLTVIFRMTVKMVVAGCLLWAASANAAQATDGGATARNNPAVLVELFTSEGCSSCPSADQVLTRLQAQPVSGVEIITLSEHVTYWNYLGWNDPYSQDVFTNRQRLYAARFRRPSVYTPQIVIDGKTEFVGHNYDQAVADIRSSAKKGKANIDLSGSKRSPDQLFFRAKISLPEGLGVKRPSIFAALVEDNLTSSVKRGENAGSRLSHSSVVRELIELDEIRSTESASLHKTIKIPVRLQSKNLRLVVFVQTPGTEVLGAATTRLQY